MITDAKYVEKVKSCILECKDKYKGLTNKGLLWDTVKMGILSFSISHASFKAKGNKDYEALLIKDVNSQEQALSISPSSIEAKEQYSSKTIQ